MAQRRVTKSATFAQYLQSIGACQFCGACFGYVFPGHTCPDWTLNLKPVCPTQVELAGGLDEDDTLRKAA